MTGAQPFVHVEGVSLTYGRSQQRVVALDQVSIDIAESEFVAILGPSGCGKSTLLRIIGGLQRPTTGAVYVAGGPNLGPYPGLGFCFQQDNLLEWRTVLPNVLLPAEIKRLDMARHRARARTLLASVGLNGFEDSYPYQLSGGMRQRVAICRALLCDTSLLLMDEPFGALDAITREDQQLLLQNLWLQEPRTIVFVTHDIREAILLADRVVVMTGRPGRVRQVYDIDLERPRTADTELSVEFNKYISMIRETLFEERSKIT